MPRKPPAPKPKPAKRSPGITPTQFRLTPDDLAALDRIVAHYHLTSRVDGVRLAVHHVAANMSPITVAAPATAKKKS